MVAEIDDTIRHHCHALIPLHTRDILFCVAGWAYFDNAKVVERGDVHALRRNVHPANVIRVRVADQLRIVVMHPIRISLSLSLPLVGSALCVALQIRELAIDPNAASFGAALELHLSESRFQIAGIHHRAIDGEVGVYSVQIGIARTPPM